MLEAGQSTGIGNLEVFYTKDVKPLTTSYDVHLMVCHGSKCSKRGAEALRKDLRKALKTQGIKAKLSKTSCQGLCKRGCILFAHYAEAPPHAWQQLTVSDAETLAQRIAKLG